MATLISYEEFSKTEEYKAFAVVNPEQGSLKVMAFTAIKLFLLRMLKLLLLKKLGVIMSYSLEDILILVELLII